MNNKTKSFIIMLIGIILIVGGIIINNKFHSNDSHSHSAGTNIKTYKGKDNFIKSSRIANSSYLYDCSSIKYNNTLENSLKIFNEKTPGEIYQNKDISLGNKPKFADIIYTGFIDDDGNSISFDLGGGFEYYWYAEEDGGPVDKYSCYNKYTYDDTTKEITLYPDKGTECDVNIDKDKTAKIKFVSLKEENGVAHLTLDFNDYTSTFSSPITSYKLANVNVTGTYQLNYTCYKGQSQKLYNEEMILEDNNKGIYRINNKNFEINYFTIENPNTNEINLYVYSKNNAIYLEMFIENQILYAWPNLDLYTKIA